MLFNQYARQCKVELSAAVVYYINIICPKQFHKNDWQHRPYDADRLQLAIRHPSRIFGIYGWLFKMYGCFSAKPEKTIGFAVQHVVDLSRCCFWSLRCSYVGIYCWAVCLVGWGMRALFRRLHLSKQVFHRWIKQRLKFSEAVYKSVTMGSFKKSISFV